MSMSYNMNKEAAAGGGGGQAPHMGGYGTHGTVYRQHTSGILLSLSLSLTVTFTVTLTLSLS